MSSVVEVARLRVTVRSGDSVISVVTRSVGKGCCDLIALYTGGRDALKLGLNPCEDESLDGLRISFSSAGSVSLTDPRFDLAGETENLRDGLSDMLEPRQDWTRASLGI